MREQEKAVAAASCQELEQKISTLEAQLHDKDQMLQNMQLLLQESASSHRWWPIFMSHWVVLASCLYCDNLMCL